MELSEEKILQRLRSVIDPEVNLNIVDMGLVYGLAIEGRTIAVEMTLTTPGCPMKDYMQNAVNGALGDLEGVDDVKIEFVWSPPWSPDKIDRAAIERLNQEGGRG